MKTNLSNLTYPYPENWTYASDMFVYVNSLTDQFFGSVLLVILTLVVMSMLARFGMKQSILGGLVFGFFASVVGAGFGLVTAELVWMYFGGLIIYLIIAGIGLVNELM